jgi:hypothetical protein
MRAGEEIFAVWTEGDADDRIGMGLKRSQLVAPDLLPEQAPFEASQVLLVCSRHVPFEQLPGMAAHAAVLIMPYADLPVTRAIQPLKLKEYLATGRPTVVTDLPATRDWADCLDLAAGPDKFVAHVRARLASGLPETQRAARDRLSQESWETKARDFERWVCGTGASVTEI